MVDVKCVLYLVVDRYVGNGGSPCNGTPLALLVTKTLNYPVAVGHFLVTVPDGGTDEEFLEERFRRAS